MKKFEYKIQPIPTKGWMKLKQDLEALNIVLNDLGKHGWEVTVALPNLYNAGNHTTNIIILKREMTH